MKRFFVLFVLGMVLTFSFSRTGMSTEEYHPIVFDELLLGGSKSGDWIDVLAIEPQIKGGEVYRIYSMFDCIGRGIGGSVELSEPCGSETIHINAPVELTSEYIAIGGNWSALPRVPKVQSNYADVYRNIVSEVLAENQLPDAPVRIVKNYRIDLEGDGVEEVFLKAEYLPELGFYCKKGTYSFILYRRIIDGKVENRILAGNFYKEDTVEFGDECPCSHNISLFADLNGDGLIEVILGYSYYEGFGYHVYEFKGRQPKKVLENGMGL